MKVRLKLYEDEIIKKSITLTLYCVRYLIHFNRRQKDYVHTISLVE